MTDMSIANSLCDISLNLNPKNNHAWNEIFVMGRWIAIDVTFDRHLKDLEERTSQPQSISPRKYFDLNNQAFFYDTHTPIVVQSD